GGGLLLFTPLVSMAWRRDLPDDAARLYEVLCGPAVESAPVAASPAAAPAVTPVAAQAAVVTPVQPPPPPLQPPALVQPPGPAPAPAVPARAAVDGFGLAPARSAGAIRAPIGST